MSKSASNSTSNRPSQGGSSRRGCLVIVPLVGGVLLVLIAVILVAYLGLRRLWVEEEPSPSMPLEVVKVTPTVATSPIPPPVSCETIVSSGDVEIAVPLPVSLTVGGETFPVAPIAPEQERWTYPPGYSGSAVWACGTVVNYVLGLEPTPENDALLSELRPGDEIQLRLSNDVELLFRFVERRDAAANEAGVFGQARPRLTLILEGEEDTWKVATADYVAETEPVESPSGSLAQIGEPVRVGDLQITVTEGYAKRGEADLQPGTMYYLVEFSVENVGTVPRESGAFNMRLQDGAGGEYLLSPTASAAGKNGPLTGEIEPDATVQGTAGYLVPDALVGPTLTWIFNPQPGSELRASVSIPFQAGEPPASAGQANVVITDAFLNRAGDALIIEGEVENAGTGPLTVEVDDVNLTSSAGMSDLRMAAPPLPWTVEPGQTQVIELQFERPAASTVLLMLLGYSFEIRGL